MVLDDDYFESIRQNSALNDFSELGALAPRVHWSERQEENRQSGAVSQYTFSFGHVRICES